MKPRVTIVVPAYNYAEFLPEALDCLLRQTLTDWECVVVDDGSTDETASVARRFCSRDARILYQHQENRGLPATRNAGLERARGEYVQFLDADDLLAPQKLETGAGYLDAHPEIAVCYCNYRPIDSTTGRLLERWHQEMLGKDPLADFLLRWELDLCIPIHCGLFRRSLWNGGKAFDERIRGKEDWLFWVDLASRGSGFHFIDQDHALYRMHGRNMYRRYDEMTLALVEATLRNLPRTPASYREEFIAASLRRIRCLLDQRDAERGPARAARAGSA